MTSKRINKFVVLFLLLIVLVFVRTTQAKKLISVRPVAIKFPSTTLSLPEAELISSLPYPSYEEIDLTRKNITETLTAWDKQHVQSNDPHLFVDSDTEIIYLSVLSSDCYAFPLAGAKMISPYAGRRTNHTGVDLKTKANDTIVAAFDGIVRMSSPYAAYGNVVVVRHYNGLETLYSHNSTNLVKVGEYVKAGQPIALTGRTGRATTHHLHFETRINGQHFNPELIFDFTRRTLKSRNLVCRKKGKAIVVEPIDLFPHQLAGSYTGFPVERLLAIGSVVLCNSI
ncbi:M23 family metallopeptidase [Parabacteroides sp. PF5-9]|uniref:M23 family metallopeptidase n=1 Tax=Parabacteroides sp. PF5-9 TaxID=1742404 RepID=UPI00247539EF|nr:M23 family metallopeptidase [Parabacteroides sp. PF5-9]MDH6358600.1 hypothetical protein [Parabacteroides sp. PF5-9]